MVVALHKKVFKSRTQPRRWAAVTSGAVLWTLWFTCTANATDWTGSHGNDWNDYLNWSTNQVPRSSADVTPPSNGNYPTISGSTPPTISTLTVRGSTGSNYSLITQYVNFHVTNNLTVGGFTPTSGNGSDSNSSYYLYSGTLDGGYDIHNIELPVGNLSVINNSTFQQGYVGSLSPIYGWYTQLNIGNSTANPTGTYVFMAGTLRADTIVIGHAGSSSGAEFKWVDATLNNFVNTTTTVNSSGTFTVISPSTLPTNYTFKSSLVLNGGDVQVTAYSGYALPQMNFYASPTSIGTLNINQGICHKYGAGTLLVDGNLTYGSGVTLELAAGTVDFNLAALPKGVSHPKINIDTGALVIAEGTYDPFKSAQVTVSSGGLLHTTGGSKEINSLAGSGSVYLDNNVLTVWYADAFSGHITLDDSLSGGTGMIANAGTLSGVIDGSGGLLKASDPFGERLLVLSGNNSYSGGTSITGGILQIGSANALGTN